MAKRDIIVVGASLGGIDALSTMVAQLPENLPAAVFIVQHTASDAPELLSGILDRRGPLPAVAATDGMDMRIGRIHVAPPDRHLLLTPDGVRIGFGPRENRSRPAIDALFRTAAVHFRSRVIGMVLTGLLDDGAAGLLAIRRCGGLAIVQDPDDAAHPAMPRNAVRRVDPDYRIPIAEAGALLSHLADELAPPPPPVPEELQLEARLTERAMKFADWTHLPGHAAPFSCPDCGGNLRELEDPSIRRFRCHVGHGFTIDALLRSQASAVEEALWVALRALDERARMLETMAGDDAARERKKVPSIFEGRVREIRTHAQQIRELLGLMAAAESDGDSWVRANE